MGLVESRLSGDGPLECLSDRIRRARRLAGISQAVLAVQVGVGPSAVAQWELPTGTTPTIDHLAAPPTQPLRWNWAIPGVYLRRSWRSRLVYKKAIPMRFGAHYVRRPSCW